MINTGMTVREVAMELPQSTRLFEKLRIDYCCGGHKPLAEACASAGVDVGEVMEMLAGVTQSEDTSKLDFQNIPLPELIAYILDTHHVFTKSEIERLQWAVTGLECPESFINCTSRLNRDSFQCPVNTENCTIHFDSRGIRDGSHY